jgi:hypothetical protein
MKIIGAVIVLGIVALLGFWWMASRTNPGVPSPSSIVNMRPAPIPLDKVITISAGGAENYTINIPSNKCPGLLHGDWQSQGKSAGISGANDDSLVGFTIEGPDGSVLSRLDHPVSGNFSFRCTQAGTYTFTFDNQGIIRSSGRTVNVHPEFQPD